MSVPRRGRMGKKFDNKKKTRREQDWRSRKTFERIFSLNAQFASLSIWMFYFVFGQHPGFPKKSPPTCLNDYRPVALTSIIMKCFEREWCWHTSRAASRIHWIPCSRPTGPTGPPQMPSQPSSTIPCPTWKIKNPTSGCSLWTTAPPSTRSSPTN